MCVLVAVSTVALLSQAPVSERHQRWLEEEAVYLITDQEEKIFKELPDEQLKAFKDSEDFAKLKTLLRKHELIK